MIQAILQDHWLLGLNFLTGLLLLSHLQQAALFGLPSLRHVLLAELQDVRRLVLVNGSIELVDGWRHLQPHQHDLLGSLQANILWPLDEASQVALGLQITTQAEVSRCLFKEWILLHLLLCGLPKRSFWQVLLASR